MNYLFAVLLFVAAAALGFLEIFVPSGGLLTILALACAAAAVVLAFLESALAGFLFLLAGSIGGAALAAFGFRIFPRTPIGRRIMLEEPSPDLQHPQYADIDLKTLRGKEGRSWTDLRPAGTAIIEGHRTDVVTEGAFIEKDTPVLVVDVEGNRVVVRQKE